MDYKGILKMLKKYHQRTFEHSFNVARLNVQFGSFLGLDLDQLNTLYISGLLHDIGKLYVPLDILTKKGELTEEDFERIKEHPKKGVLILSKITLGKYEKYRSLISNVQLTHHMFNKGKSYPEIEIEKSYISNITSICDVYEALSSERDYKKNLSKDECIKIMKKIAFDKYLFNEFLKFENVVEKEGTNN